MRVHCCCTTLVSGAALITSPNSHHSHLSPLSSGRGSALRWLAASSLFAALVEGQSIQGLAWPRSKDRGTALFAASHQWQTTTRQSLSGVYSSRNNQPQYCPSNDSPAEAPWSRHDECCNRSCLKMRLSTERRNIPASPLNIYGVFYRISNLPAYWDDLNGVVEHDLHYM